jgi:hypothetical protein
VHATYTASDALTRTIADDALRADLRALIADPRPTCLQRFSDAAARTALRDAFVTAGFVAAGTPVEGIFPPGTLPGDAHGPQPFWSAAGSGDGSHHAYPGGLMLHELFNARMSDALAGQYDRMYFDGAEQLDRDVCIGTALYHDILKTAVFQWNEDGTLTSEVTIGETGAHHVLSGAEAIARGRDPRFVLTLLSAHAAPSLGDEAKVARWAQAAAMLAGVDPLAYGLLRRDGAGFALAPDYVPMEAFVNHLADHDYVLSVHAARAVIPQLRRIAPGHGIGSGAAFAWWKNAILANATSIGLYGDLTRGESRFEARIARVSASLTS